MKYRKKCGKDPEAARSLLVELKKQINSKGAATTLEKRECQVLEKLIKQLQKKADIKKHGIVYTVPTLSLSLSTCFSI